MKAPLLASTLLRARFVVATTSYQLALFRRVLWLQQSKKGV